MPKHPPRPSVQKLLPALALWANDRPPLPLRLSETDPEVCKLQISKKVNHLSMLQREREMGEMGITGDYVKRREYLSTHYNRITSQASDGYKAHKDVCMEIAKLILKLGVDALRCRVIGENPHLTLMIWELLGVPGMEVAGAYLFHSAKSYQIWRADDLDHKTKP